MILEAAAVIIVLEIVVFMVSRGEIEVNSAIKRDTDLRLPYKRYRKIYPNVSISYDDYKKLQARTAFQSTVPSKMIKRMVH